MQNPKYVKLKLKKNQMTGYEIETTNASQGQQGLLGTGSGRRRRRLVLHIRLAYLGTYFCTELLDVSHRIAMHIPRRDRNTTSIMHRHVFLITLHSLI